MIKFIILNSQAIDFLRKQSELVIDLTSDKWNVFQSFFSECTIEKDQYLLTEGEVCDFVAFVTEGVFIYFKTLDNGNDQTIDFAFQGECVTDNYSRLSEKSSSLNIKAVESSKCLIIKQDNLVDLYLQIPEVEKLGRNMMEKAFVRQVQLSIDLQTLSAKERYLKLIKNSPNVLQKISQYHIANYLGINPKSLSRIRNNFFRDK